MIVICEECGKKYQIDPQKIKGEKAKFRCKVCNHIIVITKPEISPEPLIDVEKEISKEQTPPPPTEPTFQQEISKEEDTLLTKIEPVISEKVTPPVEERKLPSKPIILEGRKRRFGLRAKMTALFFLVPFIILLATGIFFTVQFQELAKVITNEGVTIATNMGEQAIANIAKSVAAQCKIYLDSHPQLDKKDFNTDPNFKKIAVQQVGMTGYTALYELPGPDGIWRTWAHANPKIVGIDMSTLKDSLKENFPGFWQIYTAVKPQSDSKGYYNWKDPDGRIRPKFMVCTVIEGTNYVIAATTYIDEFNQPMKDLEIIAGEHADRVRNLNFLILLIALVLFGSIVSLFGHRLTGKIKELTNAADRISVGELDFEIKLKSNDEIGDLAEAISRMQDSIRISIERLRRRKGV